MHGAKLVRLVLPIVLASLQPILASETGAADDLFLKTVAPTFAERCLSCHSGAYPKGDFSLETNGDLFDGDFVLPGNAPGSYLMELITPEDGVAEMPKNAASCSAEEVDAIRQWINAGAAWPDDFSITAAVVKDYDWWSFKPLERPVAPELSIVASEQAAWARTPVDAFVLQALIDRGLTPTGEADRRTLIRRLFYDLVGLPPSPQAVEEFVRDDSPDAYDRLVDQLLESKHYGERWARHWLDVVKYADTCGYDKDKLRPNAWPYRDYVIRSLNDDKPYGRFIQEQIAGDVLFPGEPDGIVALGFIAAGPWDFIGHVEVPESKIDGKVARNLDRDDMISNAMNTFCSLTVQCARCHNHKFDPISQQDYYSLQSVFAAVDRADRVYERDPAIERKKGSLLEELSKVTTRQSEIEQQISDAGGELLTQLNTKIRRLSSQNAIDRPERFGYHSAISKDASAPKWVQVDLREPHAVASVVVHPCYDDFSQIGAGFGFPSQFHIECSVDGKKWTRVAERVGLEVNELAPLKFEVNNIEIQYVRFTATYLAERSNDYILALAEIELLDREGSNIALDASVSSLDSIEAGPRWGRSNLVDGLWPQAKNAEVESNLLLAKESLAKLMAEIEPESLRQERSDLASQSAQINTELNALPSGAMVYAAATDFASQGNFRPTGGKPREVFVLERGDVQSPGERVEPAMLPLGIDLPEVEHENAPESARRAALARWMADRDNPLVWRSIVNRIWQYHFGTGLVSTPNDFGKMGSPPSHPELLDWLAVEFRDNGQSLKQLHRLIVRSAVYRQASATAPKQILVDGNNRYFGRMNRRRLTAEEVRDSILAVSGRLDLTMGGPGYYLFSLEKTEHSPHFEYHKFDPTDAATHRRSIYRFIARSQPNPWMSTLDCADSSQSTPTRNETLTSLQALALLNNPFNLTMAEYFAQRLEREQEDLSDQIKRAVELTLQRETSDVELQMMEAYAAEHGLENLCRLLFNLNEFVFVD